jgi:hypothetical protein
MATGALGGQSSGSWGWGLQCARGFGLKHPTFGHFALEGIEVQAASRCSGYLKQQGWRLKLSNGLIKLGLFVGVLGPAVEANQNTEWGFNFD